MSNSGTAKDRTLIAVIGDEVRQSFCRFTLTIKINRVGN